MVGVMMRANYSADRFAAQRPSKKPFPNRLCGCVANSSIKDCPTVAVIEDIDVDVVQSEWERQPRPENSWTNLEKFTVRGHKRALA